VIDFVIFFIWACREFNFGKEQGKKVSDNLVLLEALFFGKKFILSSFFP